MPTPEAEYSGTLTQLKTTWLASAKKRTLPAELGGVEIVEQRGDARRTAGHAAHGAAAAGIIAGGEGQVAVGVEEYLAVSDAVERKSEGQWKLARIVIAERDHRAALRGGGGIVAERRIRVTIARAASARRRESEGRRGRG